MRLFEVTFIDGVTRILFASSDTALAFRLTLAGFIDFSVCEIVIK